MIRLALNKRLLHLSIMKKIKILLNSQFGNFIRIKLARFKINFDEKKVPEYTLPNPLKMLNDRYITSPDEWWKNRRPEIFRLFQEFVYGKGPQDYNDKQSYEISSDSRIFSGMSTRKQITISLINQPKGPQIHLLLYVPNNAVKPVPTFLGLNFYGNHTINEDAGINITPQRHPKKPNGPLVNIFPSDKTRGSLAKRWPLEKILQHGYALATAYYGDLEPDYLGGYHYGVRSVFLNHYQHKENFKRPLDFKKYKRSANFFVWDPVNDWGAIGVWAWGLSRIMDYLETDPDIDFSKVAVFGHSRLGKAALWAGVQDFRFAIVISNNSGCGGAALYRRRFGETIKLLNLVRPHWFSENFKKFNGKEDQLPVDQHMLIALIAPRPVYVASASEDFASDPKGEYLTLENADNVYNLLGLKGLGVNQMPGMNISVGETNGYHIRKGVHDIKEYDWEQFLRFSNRHFFNNVDI